MTQRFVIPQLELRAGAVICLHVPSGVLYSSRASKSLAREIGEQAQRAGLSVTLARYAANRGGFRELFRPETSVQWLARSAEVPSHEAAALIDDIESPVAHRLADNAATPRCLLGLALASVSGGDVIVYGTVGLDPAGRWAAHRYVQTQLTDRCAVHVAWPTLPGRGDGIEVCPTDSDCVRGVRLER